MITMTQQLNKSAQLLVDIQSSIYTKLKDGVKKTFKNIFAFD